MFRLEVGIPDDDGMISVMHTFTAKTETACEKLRDAHAEICPRFGPAVKAATVTEALYEVDADEIPYDLGDGSHATADEEEEIDDEPDEADEEGADHRDE